MSKHRILEEGSPISSRIHVIVVSQPSPQEKCESLVETYVVQTYIVPLISISSRKFVLYDQMMEDFLGYDYTMDEIREAIGAQHSSEEVPVVQPLIGQSNI
jgi:hypothetical protein